jgi:transposase-like protein
MTSRSVGYKRYRFPPAMIAHAVWLYFRFPLSLRLVEEMLLERGVVVSNETVRRWLGSHAARRRIMPAIELAQWKAAAGIAA